MILHVPTRTGYRACSSICCGWSLFDCVVFASNSEAKQRRHNIAANWQSLIAPEKKPNGIFWGADADVVITMESVRVLKSAIALYDFAAYPSTHGLHALWVCKSEVLVEVPFQYRGEHSCPVCLWYEDIKAAGYSTMQMNGNLLLEV